MGAATGSTLKNLGFSFMRMAEIGPIERGSAEEFPVIRPSLPCADDLESGWRQK
jgi:hypothetical protein